MSNEELLTIATRLSIALAYINVLASTALDGPERDVLNKAIKDADAIRNALANNR